MYSQRDLAALGTMIKVLMGFAALGLFTAVYLVYWLFTSFKIVTHE